MTPPPDSQSWWVVDPSIDREQYVRRVLELYRKTPTTCGRVRDEDRRLAEHLFHQRTPFSAVEAAFHLAAARRIFRDPSRGPLAPVRSLHYFLPVIQEILTTPIDPDYIRFLAWKLRHTKPILKLYAASLEHHHDRW